MHQLASCSVPGPAQCLGASRDTDGVIALQVSVDISTSPSVFEAVEAAAVAHFKANPSDFSGEKMIIANLVGDPLKYMLCVWWEYAYPGKLSAAVATLFGHQGFCLKPCYVLLLLL